MDRARIRTRDAVIAAILIGIAAFVLGYFMGFYTALEMATRMAQKYLNVTISPDLLNQLIQRGYAA